MYMYMYDILGVVYCNVIHMMALYGCVVAILWVCDERYLKWYRGEKLKDVSASGYHKVDSTNHLDIGS